MTKIAENLRTVQAQLLRACEEAGRNSNTVRLLAVSKTFGPDAVREAFDAGQTAFGENYIQEGVEKILHLSHLPIEWHCIGPIQSNKTRLVAAHFDWVHTVDRLKIAERLNEQRPPELPPLQVCVQVNIDGGVTKSGVSATEVVELMRAVVALPRLRLRGLMCIPEPAPDYAAACAVFKRARQLFDQLCAQGFALDTLSMGMSADMLAAVHSGSTMVRVGSAIFGARSYAAPDTQAAPL
ncbi:YggS family pyridoxal phosphate-dependent enzyme [Curvibacter sp. CHRR-16]|uniref:YggS family pyridoxal phosphate-dependent enzyme n=1 Tax=Curvibacter sp. CHRR-16 TaxID=2835872 RepID=UPI001BDADE6F|nr:YggS family pyridoxal phosphate-dependent enzyme [Curvibacter sp. CHRR-16]MBT0570584.1 YggS family pyridoxal phosphate-dependent enzyme [Curvibacter sp. CHRR-16]